MQERTTTAEGKAREAAIQQMMKESQERDVKPLYLRMTPEILAELAFQQVNLLASRLSVSQREDFYERLQRYLDLSRITTISNSKQ